MRPIAVAFLIAGTGAALFALTQSAEAQVSTGDVTQHDNPNTQTPEQIMQYARVAGFDDSNILTAVAIALAESGGDANAYNPVIHFDSGKVANTPQDQGAVGLWQIYVKVHPQWTRAQLEDPQTNAQAAYSVSRNGTNFGPWTTYTNGAYQAHLDAAQQAFDALNSGPPPLGIPCCTGCVACG